VADDQLPQAVHPLPDMLKYAPDLLLIENLPVARQDIDVIHIFGHIIEFGMDDVVTGTQAQISGGILYGDGDGVVADVSTEDKPVRVRAAVGAHAEIENQVVVELVVKAGFPDNGLAEFSALAAVYLVQLKLTAPFFWLSGWLASQERT